MHGPEAYKTAIVPIEFEYDGRPYNGEGRPIPGSCRDGVCFELDIHLNGQHLGIIHCTETGWTMEQVRDQELVNMIGEEIRAWYE